MATIYRLSWQTYYPVNKYQPIKLESFEYDTCMITDNQKAFIQIKIHDYRLLIQLEQWAPKNNNSKTYWTVTVGTVEILNFGI